MATLEDRMAEGFVAGNVYTTLVGEDACFASRRGGNGMEEGYPRSSIGELGG